VVSVRNGEVATLASGLNQPMGVAFGADGTCLVSESGTGRVVSVTGSGVDTLVDGLEKPPRDRGPRRTALHRRCWC